MGSPVADRPRLPTILILSLCCFCIYCVTLTESKLGYEGETIGQAKGFLFGEDSVEGRAGLLAVAFYIPFVAADEFCRRFDLFQSFHGLLPNFALPLLMTMTVALLFLAVLEFASRRASIAVAMVFAFATMAFPYSKMGMESALTFSTTLALWGFLRELHRPGRGGYVILASGLAAILLTKVQGPLVILLFGLVVAKGIARRNLSMPPGRTLLAMGLIFLVAGAVFVWGNEVRYGRWFFSTSYDFARETAAPQSYIANLAGFFLSPGKSLFLFNPPLLLCPFLIAPLCRRHRWYLDLLLLIVLPQILFHAYFRTWADETWGPRRLLNLIPILILPLAALLEQDLWTRRIRRGCLLIAVAAGVLMQLLAVSMNYASYIWTLQPHGLGSQRNLVWSAELSSLRFQTRILASSISRWMGRGSLPYPVQAEFPPDAMYHPWNRPDASWERPRSPRTIDLDLSPYDRHFDFWWSARAARDPHWLRWNNKSPYLLSLFLSLGLGCAGLLARQFFRPAPQPAASSS